MSYKTYEVHVYPNGDKFWYQNDKFHREDGPAVEYANGSKFWFQNGKLHRTDGPAIEWAHGLKEWFLNGIMYSEENYWKKINPPPEPKELTVAEVEKLLGYSVKIVKEA